MTEHRQSFDEMYLESKAKIETEFREADERAAHARAARDAFLGELFGGGDRRSWLVPQPVTDLDAALAEHFAQLRNTVRYALQDAIDDDRTADRNYIKEFVLAADRELGKKYDFEYAEAFHYVGPAAANIGGTDSTVDGYVKRNSVPAK